MAVYTSQLASAGYKPLKYEYEGHWIHDDMPAYAAGAFETVATTQPAAICGLCMTYNSTTGACAPTSATINGDAFPDGSELLGDWYEDGDIVEFIFSAGPTQYRTFKAKVISGALYAFATGAAYTTGLGAQFTGGSSGNLLCLNITRMEAWADFLQALAWANPSSIDGTTFLDYMHSAYKAAGLTYFASFTMVGNAYKPFNTSSVAGGFQPWSMKPDGHWQATTPALTKIRALT
jgi:hypothetical protein